MNTELVEKNIAMWKQELDIITKIINKEKKEKQAGCPLEECIKKIK